MQNICWWHIDSSKVEYKICSDFQLNNDLNEISQLICQWRILFNFDPSKPAIEIFSS